MKKICIAIISIALIIAFGISLNNVEKTELQSTDGRDFEKATVTEIVSSDYSDSTSKDYDGSVGEDGSVRAGQQQIKVKIRTGEHKGEILDATSSSSYLYGARCRIGTKVIVIISESDELTTVSVYNYDRGNQLYMIIAFFLIVLVLIGGFKGFKSAVGLVFTFCCILFVFMPLIYRGVSPFCGGICGNYNNSRCYVSDRWIYCKINLCNRRHNNRCGVGCCFCIYIWKNMPYIRL